MAKEKYDESSIQVLSDREHVRLRTGVYLGSTESTSYTVPFYGEAITIDEVNFIPALYKGFNEIVDNAIDEMVQVAKKDKKVTVTFNQAENWIEVSDNGRGVPIGMHPETGRPTPETVFTALRSGRNFKDDEKDSGVIGTNGVGSSCVAMISEKFDVTINRDGKCFAQTYLNGTEIIEDHFLTESKAKDTGTSIRFKFDTSLPQFATTALDARLIENRIKETALTNPEITFKYTHIDEEDNETVQTFNYKNGMADYVKSISEAYFEFSTKSEAFTAQYFVILDQYDGIDEKLFTYVNSSLLFEGGTPNNFFFTSFFNEVSNQLKREIKSRKIDLNRNDLRQNLLVIANIKMKNPRYDNQSKTRLISQEIKKPIDEMVSKQISKFVSENSDWVEDVLARAEFRKRIGDLDLLKKDQQKRKKGKIAKLTDCYSDSRAYCSLAFSEGDCLESTTLIMTPMGGKMIMDLKVGEQVITHTGRFKKVVHTEYVEKQAFVIEAEGNTIKCSENHKWPVVNTETNEVELVETANLNPTIHRLLKRKTV